MISRLIQNRIIASKGEILSDVMPKYFVFIVNNYLTIKLPDETWKHEETVISWHLC